MAAAIILKSDSTLFLGVDLRIFNAWFSQL